MAQTMVNGLLVGGVYAVIGLGFSLVWGVMNVINLTHGAFVILGSYITFYLHSSLGVDPFLTLPVSGAILFALGYVLQRYVINLIVRAPAFMTLILTYGLAILITNVALLTFQADVRAVLPDYADNALRFGTVSLSVTRLATFAASMLITVGLMILLDRTEMGRAIRATRMNMKAATLMGVRINQVYAITYAIGAGLAGVAGTLTSLVYPFSPVSEGHWLGTAFVVCALGGLGHWAGALVGGLLLGILEVMGVVVLGVSYQKVVAFGLLLFILLVRPRGILGAEYY